MEKLTDLFNSLDEANDELNSAKASYDTAEAEASELYRIYGERLKVANDIRKKVQDSMGSAFPETLPSRVRIA